jgi:cation transport ATPase
MNPAEMIVLIVLIVTIGKVFSNRRAGRVSKAGTDIIQADPDSARMREEVKMLKDRIAVLERIATDNSSATALDREIEKLR